MGVDSFEMSSLHLSSIGKAMRSVGSYEAVVGQLQPATRAALENPNGERWYDGAMAEELWQAIGQWQGNAALTDVYFHLAKDSFSPLVMPVVKVAVAVGGLTPASIAGRMDWIVGLANRNNKVAWVSTGADSGVITFGYPRPVVAVAEHAWRGVLKFMFELTKRQGSVEHFDLLENGAQFRFAIRWK